MADQLATAADLASVLQTTVDATTAAVLLECATAVVQEAAGGQRIVEVVDDTCSILSTADSWLDLPQIPVTTVTTVVLDGVTLTVDTDYKVFGNRLWRRYGWQNNLGWSWGWEWSWRPSYAGTSNPYTGQEPSLSAITYTHGYATGAQELQFARSVVLSLAAGAYVNPGGASQERIDDYAVTYDKMARSMETSPHLRALLRKRYGRRARMVRVG